MADILVSQAGRWGIKLFIWIRGKGFRSSSGPFGECKHCTGICTADIHVIWVCKEGTVTGGTTKSVFLSVKEKVGEMEFGQIKAGILQSFFDHARLAGGKGGECPAGSVGILIFDRCHQIVLCRIVSGGQYRRSFCVVFQSICLQITFR